MVEPPCDQPYAPRRLGWGSKNPPLTPKDDRLLIAFTQRVFYFEELMDMLIKPQEGVLLRKALEKQVEQAPPEGILIGSILYRQQGYVRPGVGPQVGLSQWVRKAWRDGWDYKESWRYPRVLARCGLNGSFAGMAPPGTLRPHSQFVPVFMIMTFPNPRSPRLRPNGDSSKWW